MSIGDQPLPVSLSLSNKNGRSLRSGGCKLFPVDDFDLCGYMRIGTSFAVGHPQLCTSLRCKPFNILLRSNDLSPVVILEQHFRVTSALHGEGLGIRVDLHQLTLESFLGLWRSLLRCRLFLPVS